MRIPALLVAFVALAGCKPQSSKVQMGPLSADRYELELTDGTKMFCYVFGAETNLPARLCGDGGPTPGNSAVLFSAVNPPSGNEFSSKIGEAGEPGYYLIKPIGTQRVDSWFLGKLGTREWLAGKRLLAVDTDAEHVTHVRVIDPVGHVDRHFEAKTTTSEFVLVRGPDDTALLLVQKNGGEEILLLEAPVENPILSMTNVTEGKSPGNRKFYNSGSIDRLHHGVFQPPTGFFGHITWKGTRPLYDNAEMGPFDEVKN
jgi:hypothetical protein